MALWLILFLRLEMSIGFNEFNLVQALLITLRDRNTPFEDYIQNASADLIE
jgi:hypothetical protein